MIVWGGRYGTYSPVDTGGVYFPSTNSWKATSITLGPTARIFHTAVWASGIGKMIVWGGVTNVQTFKSTSTGGLYTP